ncbi:MAG: prepilin-type N-terminal cleavage/methylation domain-containing protein, partial [Bacilli bacterium]|nr:prepilin-type N-terminal cleavage/methylation domain-containing protein [Bacilli bacterium]
MIKKVDDKMNKKGFTLIELLGVMVVLVIIFGLAVTGSIFPINTGKLGV